MAVKDQILTMLLECRGEAVSGEEMAEQFQVTRSAVWKAIRTLQKEGYQIIGVQNKGYRLLKESGNLSKQEIERYLDGTTDMSIHIFQELESTNQVLKNLANQNAKEWTVVIADKQSGGRGRWGQIFYSPGQTGIYMSVLLRPKCELQKILPMTKLAAFAVANAVEEITNEKVQIRDQNDIYMDDKRIGGILSEASVCMETGITEHAIIGIGLNVFWPKEGFPRELEQSVTSIYHQGESDYELRNLLVAKILNHLVWYYHKLQKEEIQNG